MRIHKAQVLFADSKRLPFGLRYRNLSKGIASTFVLAAVSCVLSLSGCGGGQSTTTSGDNPPPTATQTTAPNELPITVSSGPVSGAVLNRPFVTVNVCVPGSSMCQSVDHVLLDTGSTGLRLFSSVLALTMPQQTGAGGPIYECAQFAGGFTWGEVANADVQLAGETAHNLPINIIGDTTLAPSSCSNGQNGQSSPQVTDFNGILGITGTQDCGNTCVVTAQPGFYYACVAPGNCQLSAQALSEQVQNPVPLFPTDNNGVVFDLPGIPSTGANNVQGSLFFGIGTESNNQLGSAIVFQYAPNGMTANYLGQTYFAGVDSGTPYIGFLNPAVLGFPTCSGPYYCPAVPTTLPVTIQGTNGATYNLSVIVADPTQIVNQGQTADFTLVAPSPNSVILGLPFFYNRKVFFALPGQNTPAGPGPYFAW